MRSEHARDRQEGQVPPTPARVLIVEDHADDVMPARHALAAMGISGARVTRVGNLAEALEALDRTPAAIAIIDLGLPDGHGRETVRGVRRHAPDLPLLVVSDADEPDTALAALEDGADDFLVKGEYGSRELDRAMRYARERRRSRSSALRHARELEAAERRVRSVFEATLDGILIVDAQGTVAFANERSSTLLGTKGKSVGQPFGVPLAGAEPVELDSVGDIRLRLEMRVTPVEWEGRAAHLVLLHDSTTHRTLEERLRQMQKMEALGQLTGGIAHDFNNVLTVVLGGVDALGDLVPAERHEAHAELRDIEVAATRAAGMVRRLLGFSRKGFLRFETIDLRAFAREALALTRRALPEDIEIEVSVADDVGRVRADPAALQQILLNLATNARDAMPGGGTLGVHCTREHIGEHHREQHAWIRPGTYEVVTLTDDGSGMDAATRDRIFEPFFTTKEAGSGTGLGMAMVYGLMKQHRGMIHVHSEPGRGTTVKILFPALDHDPITSEARTRLRRSGSVHGGTVLVMEDEPALRRSIERLLGRAGYEVLLAADGKEGLEMFRRARNRIDAIISDLVMPKLGGREVLDVVRAEGARCPFLLITGYGPDSVQDLPHENVAVVSKPWGPGELLEKLEEALSRSEAAGGRPLPGRGHGGGSTTRKAHG